MIDLQTGIIIAGSIAVVIAIVVMLITLFGSSGTTYEEALAEQKKATSELLALASNKKSITNKKLKKLGKKVKEKQRLKEAQSTTSEVESDVAAESAGDEELSRRPSKAHVEFSDKVEVEVPVEKHTPINKRRRDLKLKPILLNKDDPSCDKSNPTTPADCLNLNHFEMIHPKDEMELMTEKVVEKKPVEEKKEAKVARKSAKQTTPPPKDETPPVVQAKEKASADNSKKGKKEKKQQSEDATDHVESEPIEEPVVQRAAAPLKVEQIQTAPPPSAPAQSVNLPTGGGKKSKNKKADPNTLSAIATSDAVSVSDLMRLISESPLSHEEIQLLTDALLNKQHGPQHSEWTEGPNDPMQKLKKQLAEKEKALADEQEASQALHAKLKELRNLVNTERVASKAARTEVTSLGVALRRATDEAMQLRHELKTKMEDLSDIQNHRVQMELHIQRLSESEAVLMHQLAGLQAEIAAQGVTAREQHAHLAHQLQEANRLYAELEAQRQAMEHSEQTVQEELRQTKEWLANVQGDLERANRANDEESKRANELSEQLEALKSQSDPYKSHYDALKAQYDAVLTQHEALKRQLDTLKTQTDKLAPLQTQYDSLKSQHEALKTQYEALKPQHEATQTQYEALKTQFEVLKTQNEALQKQYETLRPQHEALKVQHDELAIKLSEKPQQNGVTHDKSEKVEAAVESVRAELAAAMQLSADQHKQINTLRNEITEYKTKNDELRTKNWKVLEALQTAEKALQAKTTPVAATTTPADIHESVQKACEQQYKEIKEILAKGCPQVTVSKASSDKEWLSTFAASVTETISRAKVASDAAVANGASGATEGRTRELEEANAQLKSLVDKYKSVINETEGMLSRLQLHVSNEEERWANALKEKQKELDAHLAATQQMQKKVDTLQETLERERLRSGSMADIERRNEETNRVPQLFEKINGPPQVGLEEI